MRQFRLFALNTYSSPYHIYRKNYDPKEKYFIRKTLNTRSPARGIWIIYDLVSKTCMYGSTDYLGKKINQEKKKYLDPSMLIIFCFKVHYHESCLKWVDIKFNMLPNKSIKRLLQIIESNPYYKG